MKIRFSLSIENRRFVGPRAAGVGDAEREVSAREDSATPFSSSGTPREGTDWKEKTEGEVRGEGEGGKESEGGSESVGVASAGDCVAFAGD